MDTTDDITIRTATLADLDTILHQRKDMFMSMGYSDDAMMEASQQASREFFSDALTNGRYRGWLAQERSGKVIAGGGIVISMRPSHPAHPGLHRADILNMYTEPPYRKRGIARQLMLTMIGWCRQEGFHWVTLHASDDGRKLYESLGFRQTSEMKLNMH